MVKYLGSKRRLLDSIEGVIRAFPSVRSVVDAFSGTARVGHRLKSAGYRVTANDHNEYAFTLAKCYVEADPDLSSRAQPILDELNQLPGKPGYFTETFCIQSRFFQPQNGAKIDAIRERIETMILPEPLRSVVLTSLLEAADRVDSTTGLQMAYLKSWASRSFDDLTLRMPNLVEGKGRATLLEAHEAVKIPADLIYLDPPYNQHSYLGNYHIWETLVRWDKPEAYGMAQKRLDVRARKSPFNSKAAFLPAFEKMLANVTAPAMVISFSDEGFLSFAQLVAMLTERGETAVLTHDYPRYVGAQIGIYNKAGSKVGKVGKLRNREYLFVCAPELPATLEPHRILTADGTPSPPSVVS